MSHDLIQLCCRHGVRQLRSGWADGPAYVTQCPIQTGQSYTYNFTITGQRGTLFWHAHISWLRATLYGPIIILPRQNESYPFRKPYKEVPIIFGNEESFSFLYFPSDSQSSDEIISFLDVQGNGGMWTPRRLLIRLFRQEEVQMFQMHTLLTDFQGPCTIVPPKVISVTI